MDLSTQILVKNAIQHLQQKEFDKAAVLLDKALVSCPNDPDVLRFMSVNLALQFNFDAALKKIDQVLALTPNNGLAHSNRGNILKELHRHEEALISLDRAIAFLPEYAEAYINKGNVLQELHRYEEALTYYDKAVQLQPNYAEAYSNKGNALELLRRHEEAIENYDMAIAANPKYVDAYWHKALSQLAGGNYELGWQNYEARWFKACPIKFQHSDIPRLQNIQQATGKNILIWAEQGLGDTFQFCRYIKPLAANGAKIVFVVPQALMLTLQSLNAYCTLAPSTEGMSNKFDYQSPLLSLPLVFGATKDSIPVEIPYLYPQTEKVKYFSAMVGNHNRLRVGLVWNGGFRADHPELWSTNERRNIRLELIANLQEVQGVDFYSLQKGDPAESELKLKQNELWPAIINLVSNLNDFSDTAGIIENLDLVISVDTSTAHLAGALGKPVWILNRYDSCWRWLRGKEGSPWYPTARIYQQKTPGDWDEVISRVKLDLKTLAQKSRASI